MHYSKILSGSLIVALFSVACNNEPKQDTNGVVKDSTPVVSLKEEELSIKGDGANLNSFLVYNDSAQGVHPAVIVVPEWWGLNDYPKMRARELAKLGYVALALDIYGDGKIAGTPDSAKAFAGPFYAHPEKAKARIDAAIAALKTNPHVDTTKIAAIGYCFGGGILINTARLGDELKGVVSFHGSLLGTPAKKELLKTRLLVLHGNDDKFVLPAEVTAFKKQMDSIGAKYTFVGYDSATHAFTNPASTATGAKFNMPIAYNAKADSASWAAMKDFFNDLFR